MEWMDVIVGAGGGKLFGYPFLVLEYPLYSTDYLSLRAN